MTKSEEWSVQSEKSGKWTIQSELCTLAGVSSVADALVSLAIVSKEHKEFKIIGESEWRRGGAETYVYDFAVLREDGSECHLVLKACVAYAPQSSVDGILAMWAERRELLRSCGVGTPRLYFSGRGVILEEYIPHPFWTHLKNSSGGVRMSLLVALAHYIAVLANLGFKPIDAFSDLRSNGDDAIVIDFGEDLGPPNRMTSSSLDELARGALRVAEVHGVPMTANEVAIISQRNSLTRH